LEWQRLLVRHERQPTREHAMLTAQVADDVTQASLGIKVAQHDVLASTCQFTTEIPRGGCLAHTALSMGNTDAKVVALYLTRQTWPARRAARVRKRGAALVEQQGGTLCSA
jgi:hypothetical protein